MNRRQLLIGGLIGLGVEALGMAGIVASRVYGSKYLDPAQYSQITVTFNPPHCHIVNWSMNTSSPISQESAEKLYTLLNDMHSLVDGRTEKKQFLWPVHV